MRHGRRSQEAKERRGLCANRAGRQLRYRQLLRPGYFWTGVAFVVDRSQDPEDAPKRSYV